MSKALKKRDETALATTDYTAFAGDDGFEGQTSDDVQIPYLNLLQKGSKQCEGEVNEVEGAKPGMLINSVTGELYPDKVQFIPCFRFREFVEWVNPDHGEGLVARWKPEDEIVKRAIAQRQGKFGKLSNPDDETHDIIDTVYVFGLIGEDLEPICISFSSTKHTPLRRWNTQMKMCTVPGPEGKKIRPPLYANRVLLSTKTQVNKGKTSFNYVIEPAEGDVKKSLLATDDERFIAAVAFRELIQSGVAQRVEEAPVGGGDDEDGDGAF